MPAGNNRYEAVLRRALDGLPIDDVAIRGAGNEVEVLVRVDGRPVALRVRSGGRGWPHEIEDAIRDIGEPWPRDLVLVARDLSEGSLRLLRQREANWADLTGQARIVAPGGLAVLREPLRSPTPAQAAPTFRWSPSAVSVAEAVLTLEDSLGTAEVAALTGWSPAQVSKVMQAFDRSGWTRRKGAQRGPSASREVADREGLLAGWSEWLREEQRPRRFAHTTRRDMMALVDDELVPAFERHSWMLSGWAAAARLAPLSTAVPTLQVYLAADELPELSAALARTSLHEVEEGGRIEFWPVDKHALRLARRDGDAPLASAPRIYADLRRFGERGADAADHLKAWWLEGRAPGGEST